MQVSFAELLLAKVCCSSSRIFSISGCGSNTYEQLMLARHPNPTSGL